MAHAAVGASVLIVATGGIAVGTRAYAVFEAVKETGTPGMIVLRSDPGTPVWTEVEAGDQLNWLVEVRLTDAQSAELRLDVDAAGQLLSVADMDVAITTCDVGFHVTESLSAANAATPACDGVVTTVLTRSSLADIEANGFELVPLPAIAQGEPQELLVEIFLAEDADADAVLESRAAIGIGLLAEGESLPAAQPPALGNTGADVATASWLAVGLVALGLSILARRRVMQEVRAWSA